MGIRGLIKTLVSLKSYPDNCFISRSRHFGAQMKLWSWHIFLMTAPAPAFGFAALPSGARVFGAALLGSQRILSCSELNALELTSSAIRKVTKEARLQGDRVGARAARAQELARELRRAEHNPRGEVINIVAGKLLNEEQKRALGAWLPPWLLRVQARLIGYTRQKEAILRWRIAKQRALVDKAAREILALEERVEKMSSRPDWAVHIDSIQQRIQQRRRDAGAAEALILGYKRRLGASKGARRPGLLGDVARAAETFNAAEERAAKVVWGVLRGQRDPWALLRIHTTRKQFTVTKWHRATIARSSTPSYSRPTYAPRPGVNPG